MRNLLDSVLAVLFASAIAAAAAPRSVAQVALSGSQGASPGGQFGYSVGGFGDANADGFADVIVGAILDGTAAPNGGAARVYSGRDGTLLFERFGATANASFGYSVAFVGDVNGDGRDDVAVGAPYDDLGGAFSGSARVFSGNDGSVLLAIAGDPSIGLRSLGWSVSGAGDANGDGTVDVVVGCPMDSGGTMSTKGSARVYSGANGASLVVKSASQALSDFGWSVAGIGDANQDGLGDFVVGAPKEDLIFTDRGAARLYSGNGALLLTWLGGAAGEELGTSVAGAGDVTGDGRADVVLGSPLADPGGLSNAGTLRTFDGATGALVRAMNGDTSGDLLGFSVARAGDFDLDSVPDAIAGGHGDHIGGFAKGSAKVFHGKSGNLIQLFAGENVDDRFGWAVSGAGDTNGDGRADVIVGGTQPFGGAGYARVLTRVTGLSSFGTGTPGCGGPQFLSASGLPKIGTAGFALRTTTAPAGAAGLGLVADVADLAGSDPFALGILLHVDLAASALVLSLDATADAAGYATSPLPIPANPALAGLVIHAQTLWLWAPPCAPSPFGLSTSRALKITILL